MFTSTKTKISVNLAARNYMHLPAPTFVSLLGCLICLFFFSCSVVKNVLARALCQCFLCIYFTLLLILFCVCRCKRPIYRVQFVFLKCIWQALSVFLVSMPTDVYAYWLICLLCALTDTRTSCTSDDRIVWHYIFCWWCFLLLFCNAKLAL